MTSRRSLTARARTPSTALAARDVAVLVWCKGGCRHRRWNLSYSPASLLSLGAHEASLRGFGAVYPGELNLRANRLFCGAPFRSVPWSDPGARGHRRWRARLLPGQPPITGAGDLAAPRHRAGDRGDQINLHALTFLLTPGLRRATIKRAIGKLFKLHTRFIPPPLPGQIFCMACHPVVFTTG